MAKRSIILLLGVCFPMVLFAVRTQSETDDPNQTRKSTDSKETLDWDMIVKERMKASEEFFERWQKIEAEKMKWSKEFDERTRGLIGEQKIRALKQRRRESDKFSRQYKLARDQYNEKLAKLGLGRLVSREKKHEMSIKMRRDFIYEKYAIGTTEEKWKLIKTKLERIRELRKQLFSAVQLSHAGGPSEKRSGSRISTRARAETFPWSIQWKGKPDYELTEARKLAEQLVALVERSNTTPQAFRVKMDALRNARAEEAELKKSELSKVRNELRELLTTREEAALVLSGFL